MGFPGGSAGNESACNVGVLGLIPGLGRSPREGNGDPLQYSGLENSRDREVRRATDHGVVKSWTQLKGLSLLIPNLMGHSEPAESHTEGQKAVVR